MLLHHKAISASWCLDDGLWMSFRSSAKTDKPIGQKCLYEALYLWSAVPWPKTCFLLQIEIWQCSLLHACNLLLYSTWMKPSITMLTMNKELITSNRKKLILYLYFIHILIFWPVQLKLSSEEEEVQIVAVIENNNDKGFWHGLGWANWRRGRSRWWVNCPSSKGNHAPTQKFERLDGKNTKSKICLKLFQNLCPLSHLKALLSEFFEDLNPIKTNQNKRKSMTFFIVLHLKPKTLQY